MENPDIKLTLHRNENLGHLWKEYTLQRHKQKEFVAKEQTVVVFRHVHKFTDPPPFKAQRLIPS